MNVPVVNSPSDEKIIEKIKNREFIDQSYVQKINKSQFHTIHIIMTNSHRVPIHVLSYWFVEVVQSLKRVIPTLCHDTIYLEISNLLDPNSRHM
jgi:hypothetical protein